MFDSVIIKYQVRDALIYWVLIPLAVILSGKGFDVFLGFPEIPYSKTLLVAALILFVPGLWLIWASMRDLGETGGTPNPLRPPKKLVTTGSYSICRHPMFLGYDLCALAVVLLFRSHGMLWISFPIFIVLEIRFLLKEEKILLARFRQSYPPYRERTSFLLPLSFIKHFSRRQ